MRNLPITHLTFHATLNPIDSRHTHTHTHTHTHHASSSVHAISTHPSQLTFLAVKLTTGVNLSSSTCVDEPYPARFVQLPLNYFSLLFLTLPLTMHLPWTIPSSPLTFFLWLPKRYLTAALVTDGRLIVLAFIFGFAFYDFRVWMNNVRSYVVQ
jgi:hypothetical protein